MSHFIDTELIETDVTSIADQKLINRDLSPTKVSERSWGTYAIAALWIGMSVNIPTYMLASGLIAGGMNWWQALMTIGLGNLIVLIPMVLNAHAGTKYGIPFPVLARASFGTKGSNIPALLRAIVACGWFGIQTWIGGQAFNLLITIIFPGWAFFSWGPGIGFMLFWAMNVYFIVKGIESIKWLESYGAPFLLLVGLGLLIWAYVNAGGVTVSYFEWIRNLSHIRFGRMERRFDEIRGQHLITAMESLTNATVPDWIKNEIVRRADELDLVRSGLDDTMRMAYQELSTVMKENDKIKDFRTAAYVIAVKKISRSYLDLGVY